jgi:protein-S-isoprenylcysteine O-methyltransferase Ste14
VVGALLAVAMWLLAQIPPSLPPLPHGARVGAAVLLAATGIAFDVLGLLAFLRSRTTVNPLRPEKTSALVTGGVYTIKRNPMYVGLALLLTGWAVYLGALWPFAGPALFVLYIDRLQIRPEQRALERLFGAQYTAYAARVRRWL